jgi:hypothetical protein
MIADGFALYCDVGRIPRMIADSFALYCDVESRPRTALRAIAMLEGSRG